MKIKFLALAAFCLCLPFAGCSLAVSDEENGNGEQTQETFTDACTGLVVMLYDENYGLLTSETAGDENCIAFWIDYTAGGEYGVYASDGSGGDYLFDGSVNSNHYEADTGVTASCSASGVVYLNAAIAENMYISLDALSRGENGELLREQNGTLWAIGDAMVEQTTTAKATQEIKKTETLNGESTESVETLTLTVTITVKIQEVGTDWRILQYAEDGSLLSAVCVSEENTTFSLAEGCAFFVSEETVAGEVKRTLYEQEDGKLPSVDFFLDGGFGFLKKVSFTAV